MDLNNLLDIGALIFALLVLGFYIYQGGWQGLKNNIHQATRKDKLMSSSHYLAFCIGSAIPTGLVIFIGMQLGWPEVIYMSLATGVFVFLLYFLSKKHS